MLPVSRSSPENSRPLGLLFSNNLNLHIKISNFLAKSDHFEHFLKSSIFEVIWPILYEKNLILRYSIFWMNQKFLSVFWKFYLWKFSSVLTHFVWEKINFEIFNFLDESEDSEHFLKNYIFENFYKCFDPLCVGKILNLKEEKNLCYSYGKIYATLMEK